MFSPTKELRSHTIKWKKKRCMISPATITSIKRSDDGGGTVNDGTNQESTHPVPQYEYTRDSIDHLLRILFEWMLTFSLSRKLTDAYRARKKYWRHSGRHIFIKFYDQLYHAAGASPMFSSNSMEHLITGQSFQIVLLLRCKICSILIITRWALIDCKLNYVSFLKSVTIL